MSYIDGFVIPVPAARKQAYRDMTAKAAPIFGGFELDTGAEAGR
jgi:uncharacterized protein YbaA (DUF1428 family)